MKKKIVVFRADASLQIGTGHVMRCLTLADTLRERSVQCVFVSRPHAGHGLDVIRRRGYEVLVLDAPVESSGQNASRPPHASWLGASQDEDAAQTIRQLTGRRPDWLVVDHYALDARWEHTLRPHCARLMVIDDLTDRPHDCDLLLDQNLGRMAADYQALVPANCELLIGPEYALLRPEFAVLRERSLVRRRQPQLRRLLITLGGMDKDNVTARVLDALRSCPLPADCRITVVMGAQAPGLNDVRQKAATMPWPAQVLVDVQNMAALMADSDLAIGAAGSTSWERCCMGLPTLLLVLAENQRGIAEALHAAGAAHKIDGMTMVEELQTFFRARETLDEKLQALSQSAQQVTQGAGASLVAGKLLENLVP